MLCAVALALSSACADEDGAMVRGQSKLDASVATLAPSPPNDDALDATIEGRGTAFAMEPALRASFVRARQSEATERHRVVRTAGTFEARNDEQRIAIRFEDEAVALGNIVDTRSTEAWNAALRFAGIGRAGARRQPALRSVHTEGSRVVYERDGMDEWYVNGPLGLEQGFTLASAEPGEGQLTVEIAIDGDLRPQWNEERLVIDLLDAEDHPVLQVSDLFATDATGKLLPTSLNVENGNVVLRVDDSAATYPIEVDPLVTAAETIVQASDHEDDSQFGFAVAVDGDRAVVGAPEQDSGAGAAYVFVRSGSGAATTWTQESKLRPPALPDSARKFGTSVSISGSRIAIGAPRTRDGGQGRAFVFVRSGSWSLEAIVTGEHDGGFQDDDGDRFGTSIAIDNNTLCVGAPEGELVDESDPDGPAFLINTGLVLCFGRSGSAWNRTSILRRATEFDLGASLALMRNTLLVGDFSDNASLPGSVSWFERTNESSPFTFQATLRPPASINGGRFGFTIALAGVTSSTNGTAIIGEPGASTSRGARSGQAHVFTRGSSGWSREATLVPSDAMADSGYGLVGIATHAGINQRMAVVSGGISATLFLRSSGGTWTEQSKVPMLLVRAVDMDSSTLALGIPQVFFGTNEARLYRLGRTNGDSCTSTSQCASGFCVDGRCCNSACGGGAADCQACSTTAGGTTNGTCTALTSAAAAAVTCRLSGGTCDVAEKCSSSSRSCPSNRFRPATFECRESSDEPCDVAEFCTGSSATCPGNQFAARGTTCRRAEGTCDIAEKCTGSSAACPIDGKRPMSYVCRAPRPDEIIPGCDPAEVCDGTSVDCPADFQLCPF